MKNMPAILLLVLLSICSTYSQQVFDAQLERANRLYEQEKYFDAVTELKRLVFFDKKKEYLYKANFLMGKSYREGAKLSEAIYHFTLAEINSKSDHERYDAAIEVIKANILRRTTIHALDLISRLEGTNKYPDKTNELNYWRGWAYIFEDNYVKASESFGKIANNHELKLISDSTYNELYSPGLAKILSIFLPGAGQFYTGNYLNGVISLAWNIFSGYLTVNAFVEDRIFDGIITGNLLWLRFYVGNIQNAEEFAEQGNKKISDKLLHYLQYEYKGEKP